MRMLPNGAAAEPAETDYSLLRAGLRAAQAATPTARAHSELARLGDESRMPPSETRDLHGMIRPSREFAGSYLELAKVMIGKPT